MRTRSSTTCRHGPQLVKRINMACGRSAQGRDKAPELQVLLLRVVEKLARCSPACRLVLKGSRPTSQASRELSLACHQWWEANDKLTRSPRKLVGSLWEAGGKPTASYEFRQLPSNEDHEFRTCQNTRDIDTHKQIQTGGLPALPKLY